MNQQKEMVSVFTSYDKQKGKKYFFINGDENNELISYVCSSNKILKKNISDISIVFNAEIIGKCKKQDFLDIFDKEDLNIKEFDEDEIYNYFLEQIRNMNV